MNTPLAANRAYAYAEFPDGSWFYLTTVTGGARIRITSENGVDVFVSAAGKVHGAPGVGVQEIAAVLARHRVNYHQRNVGGETADTLRYTSCDGCEWLGGWHDGSGWEAHLAPLIARALGGVA